MKTPSAKRVRELLRLDGMTGELYRYRPFAKRRRVQAGSALISIDGVTYKAGVVKQAYFSGVSA